MDVAVLVVTYDNAEHIDRLIASLRHEAASRATRVVVVDNDSNDDTVERLLQHPDVVTVRAEGNLGYAGGLNLAHRQAGRARTYLVLNPDLVVEPGALDALLRRMDSTGADVVVPALIDDDGSVYRSLRREPTVVRTFGEALLGDRLAGRPGWLAETVRNPRDYREAHPIEWATGAALAVRADGWNRVGGWDERYFLYSEETDFLRRVRETGGTVWFEPAARMQHSRGGSGSSDRLAALLAVNRVRYARSRGSRARAAGIRAGVALAALLRAGRPTDRTVLRTVLSERSWARLPGPSAERAVSAATGSVVIAAHDEEAVIGRCLSALAPSAAAGVLEVVVVPNGCHDETANVARGYEGVVVDELSVASKTAALNRGDELATAWPRLYLDADVEISPRMVTALFDRLELGTELAARPASADDTSRSSLVVRSYYRARSRIPALHNHLWGAGAYALSKAGRARFVAFPDVVADDLWVDRQFGAREKCVVDGPAVRVRAPRSLANLLAISRRGQRGKRELFGAGSADATGEPTVRIVDVVRTVRGPVSAIDALTYLGVAVLARRRRSGAAPHSWERDDSSRS